MLSTWTFMKRFARSPAAIGSIVPSSRFLVTKMLECVDWQTTDHIVELGAGTGVITAAIDAQRKPGSTFISFERDDDMRHELNARFPDVHTHHDAFLLPDVLANHDRSAALCPTLSGCLALCSWASTPTRLYGTSRIPRARVRRAERGCCVPHR